jgi:hypothetical protein
VVKIGGFTVPGCFFDNTGSNCQDGTMNPELGFGFRSIGRLARRAYNVAALPVRAATKIANATAASLCRDGKSMAGDAKSQSFCRAMKMKDTVKIRQLLPSAVQQAAARAESARTTTQQIYATATRPVSEADTNLLAALHGANPDELSFALAGVDPDQLSGVSSNEFLAMAPIAAAVVAGFWLLKRR